MEGLEERGEIEGDGEGEDGGDHAEDAPGELEVVELGEVVPDGDGDGTEHQDEGGGQGGRWRGWGWGRR